VAGIVTQGVVPAGSGRLLFQPRRLCWVHFGRTRLLAKLTTYEHVVTIANVSPQLITRFKDVTADGAILEVLIWKVPKPVPPTDHGYKYSAVYVVDGVRTVGFDNERGKGDHCHLDGIEVPYAFTSVDQLIEDFIAAVAARRTP
jgi:hypothetical protein